MIKAVIFDMDGVLIESEIEYMNRFQKILEEANVKFDLETLYSVIGTSTEKTKEILDEMTNKAITGDRVYELYDESLITHPINYKEIATKNGFALMQALKAKGYKIGVASATQANEIRHVMQETGLIAFVDALYSGSDCAHNKPAPDVYLKVMEMLGVIGEECVVLEDSKSGIQAATTANAYVVARKDNRFNIDQSQASESIDDLLELERIVDRQNG